MIKLTDLLNEVNIAPAVDKAKLLGKIANYSLYLLSYLTYSNSNVNEFLDNYGYNDMKEFEQEEDVEATELAKLYFKKLLRMVSSLKIKDTYLSNLRDEIYALIYQTLYMLSLDKKSQ